MGLSIELSRRAEQTPVSGRPSLVMYKNDALYRVPREGLIQVGGQAEITIPLPSAIQELLNQRNPGKLGFHLCSNIAQFGGDSEIVRTSDDKGEITLRLLNHGGNAIELSAGATIQLGHPFVLGKPLTLADVNYMLETHPESGLTRFHNSENPEPYFHIPIINQISTQILSEDAIPLHDLPRGTQRDALHKTIGVAPHIEHQPRHETSIVLGAAQVFSIPEGYALRILHGTNEGEIVRHSASVILKPGYNHRIITETYGEIDTMVCCLERISFV